MIVVATQIKLNSALSLFYFFAFIKKILKQLKEAEGLKLYKLRGFRTITAWESKDAMKQFRNNGAHLEAMKNIKQMGHAKTIAWETEVEPTWEEAKKKLATVTF